MNGDLKQTFILQALAEYNQRVQIAMRRMMRKMKVGVSEEGFNSIAYNVAQQGAGAASKLSFKEYLRMVDMGVGRSHPLGGLKAVTLALKSKNQVGKALVKDNTRKPKKVYSKTAYGNLTWLNNKLLYGFTEETIELLKKELQYQNTTN
jgi:hypothetical protein